MQFGVCRMLAGCSVVVIRLNCVIGCPVLAYLTYVNLSANAYVVCFCVCGLIESVCAMMHCDPAMVHCDFHYVP